MIVTREDLIKELKEICDDLKKTAVDKGHDYSGDDGDTFKNIRMAARLGIVDNDNQSCLVRLGDKFSRLIQLTGKENTQKVDESIYDTTKDMMLYTFYNYLIWKYKEQ